MISFVSVGVVESLHNLRLSATPPVVVADADKEVWGFIALLLLLLLFCSMGELTVFSVTAAYLTIAPANRMDYYSSPQFV